MEELNVKIRVSKETEDLIQFGDAVMTDTWYYHIPMYFKKTEEEGVYEILRMDQLRGIPRSCAIDNMLDRLKSLNLK